MRSGNRGNLGSQRAEAPSNAYGNDKIFTTCYTSVYNRLTQRFYSQSARNPSSATPPSTTTMSALSVSQLKRAMEVPRRIALRSVSLGECQWPGNEDIQAESKSIDTIDFSLPSRTLRNPMRCAQALVRPEINVSSTREPGIRPRSSYKSIRTCNSQSAAASCHYIALAWA